MRERPLWQLLGGLTVFWCALAVALVVVMSPRCPAQNVTAKESQMTTIHYAPSDQIFPNPERGFYWRFQPPGGGIPGQQDIPHGPLVQAELQALRDSDDGITLVRDCILIPRRFWAEPIPKEYLDEIQHNFDAVREAGLKVVPRFVYDWGMLNRDPDEAVIMSHLKQLALVLRRNADVIAWVQAGLYGGTGEGCRSDHGYVYEDPNSQGWQRLSEAGRRIYERELKLIPSDRMMTIRYPRLKWDMLGWNSDTARPVNAETAYADTTQARIGYYSDGFMGDEHHYAMYRLPNELGYTMADTGFVIQEGEISDATEWKLQPGLVVSEMEKLHQTALNRSGDGWRMVSDAWKRNGDYNVVARRMGYRFRLISATMPVVLRPGEAFAIQLVMANDGFARIMNPRSVEVVLRNTTDGAKHVIRVDGPRGNRLWFPGPGETVSRTIPGILPANLASGEWEMFLNLPDPYESLHDRPEYSIRLANVGTWEAVTGYNRLLHTVLMKSSGEG